MRCKLTGGGKKTGSTIRSLAYLRSFEHIVLFAALLHSLLGYIPALQSAFQVAESRS